MKQKQLFYSPLWQENLAQLFSEWPVNSKTMVEKIYSLAEKEQGVDKTNFGGWQSDDDLYKYEEFGWLLENIIELGNQLAPEFGTSKTFNDGHLWANINSKNDFNIVHTHPDAILSGAVYLKISQEDQGLIEFFDAREGSPTAHWQCYTQFEEKTDLTTSVHSVAPQEGDILFFPGWLRHWVSPNLTSEDRISISFNMSMH